MKKLILSVAILLAAFTGSAQVNTIYIDNQLSYDIYYRVHGDNSGCTPNFVSGLRTAVAGAGIITHANPSGVIPGLGILDSFNMVEVYTGHPAPPPGPCSPGSVGATVSECYALGYGPGPSSLWTMQVTMPGPLCWNNMVTVEWLSNTPTAGTATVVIY